MPYRYDIDVKNGLVRSAITGVLTKDDLYSSRREIRADPRFSADYSQLVDMTGMTDVQVDVETMREYAATSIYHEHTRIAVVVHRKDVYGMLRMYETFRQLAGIDQRMRIFETMEAAQAWLDEPRPAR